MATMKRTRRPSLPGEILRDLYLVPNNISPARFAEPCGVTDKHMQAIVSGRAPRLTAQMAIRIATALGTTPEYWLDLQRGGRAARRAQAHRRERQAAAADRTWVRPAHRGRGVSSGLLRVYGALRSS